jgi:hypothetical protein
MLANNRRWLRSAHNGHHCFNTVYEVVMGISVADPGCLSRIPDPDFYPSRIPDLGYRIQKQQQKRGVKKN